MTATNSLFHAGGLDMLLPAHYQLLFERNPIPMLVVARSTCTILAANEAAARSYGYALEQLLEMDLASLFTAEEWPQVQVAIRTGKIPASARWRQRRCQGAVVAVQMECTPLELQAEAACLLVIRDRNTRAANPERDRLNAVVSASHDAIISTNIQGEIKLFNPAAEHIFGMRCHEVMGQCVDILLPERFRADHAGFRMAFAHSKCLDARMMGLRRVKGLRADGSEIDLEGCIANVLIEGQPVLITTLRDITHSLVAEAEQQIMRKRLSQLTQRLMSQEKDLIKRMSLALHDQLGQTLATVRIVHETIATIAPQTQSVEATRLHHQLGTLIDQAIHQIRVVLTDLQPPMLGENGLACALDNELRNRALSQRTMQLVLHAPPEVACLRWPAAVEHTVFMIAREAVENGIRHSEASLLSMSLAGSASDLTLEVWDNGRGYPANAEASAGHLGLIGITERAKSIGARVTINPGATGGAHLVLHWEATP